MTFEITIPNPKLLVAFVFGQHFENLPLSLSPRFCFGGLALVVVYQLSLTRPRFDPICSQLACDAV